MSDTYKPAEQQQAHGASKEKIMAAISSETWLNEDTQALLPHTDKIPAEKRVETLEFYRNAFTNNQLTQEPDTLPPRYNNYTTTKHNQHIYLNDSGV